ncbi:cellulose biosynthesis protein BcsF [Marinobacterium marinum]|uniref:Cellulose biosynthesis protein BcsF n=1 Tax=Marinobacterium marinum TaxID=2756129 RepID=A0A7W1WV78_9GAMM|nr:cellulose biosynthesis protein BcsF [Marinobacterium marinum]MBA4500838.1 cellulose biosynthesis protein BcsF [Marinobacterium marinum]
MIYTDVLQVAAIGGLLSLFLGWLVICQGRRLLDWFSRRMPARYLKEQDICSFMPEESHDNEK